MILFVLILVLCFVSFAISGYNGSDSNPVRIQSAIYPHSNSTCSPVDHKELKELVRNELSNFSDYPPCLCGGVESWTRVAYLNMSDPSQQCPSNLTLITTPIRGCGRRAPDNSCDSVIYPVHDHTYSSVCGRIVAYQKGLASGFFHFINSGHSNINSAYLDGVSITHGPAGSRQHIWSFVGATYMQGSQTDVICPCTNPSISWPHQVPSFINNNYFCDSGNPGSIASHSTYFTNDPLWDGSGCNGTSTCCEFNSPPWFCQSLLQRTSDDLEIRNCYADHSSAENKIITLIEVYIK